MNLALSLGAALAVAATGLHAQSIIAFTKGDAICTATADGKNVRTVLRHGADPCISADGRFLVYTASKGPDGPGFTRSLRVRELATGKEHPLPANGAEQVYGALWSPDDEWIAFNVLLKQWQVAVVRPDGRDLRVLTGMEAGKKDHGTYLAGWNFHDHAVLAQDLTDVSQISPSGEVAWKKPAREVLGADSTGSDQRCTISRDGTLLITAHQVETDEFNNLDGPSSYLVAVHPPGHAAKRLTPQKFCVSYPWLAASGRYVLFRGFWEKDVKPIKGSDGVKLSERVYRMDLATGKMTPLIEGADNPSASRD